MNIDFSDVALAEISSSKGSAMFSLILIYPFLWTQNILIISFKEIVIPPNHHDESSKIIMLPFVLVALFGVHSLVTILYRVFTLSDCTEAAQELQKQIKEAREDLISKGFKFRD
ncbi:unnamed protein product [Hermetia illucens]|uniref:Dolichol-phosphate mannosyltransferase subunit 3 n=1 Tax=Hermetia illucens TaxID=343691 RepID=A0A7R8V1Z2_HERIL|nr:unnamed protein product [Hermetia illucens]